MIHWRQFRVLGIYSLRPLYSEELILPEERSSLCPWLLGCNPWTLGMFMLGKSLFFCLGTLAARESNNVLYNGGFGPYSMSSTYEGTGDQWSAPRYQV